MCTKTTYKQIMTSDNVQNLLTFDERASTASLARNTHARSTDLREQMYDVEYENAGRSSARPAMAR